LTPTSLFGFHVGVIALAADVQHLTVVAERTARDERGHGLVDRTGAEAAAHRNDRHAFGREAQFEPRA